MLQFSKLCAEKHTSFLCSKVQCIAVSRRCAQAFYILFRCGYRDHPAAFSCDSISFAAIWLATCAQTLMLSAILTRYRTVSTVVLEFYTKN